MGIVNTAFRDVRDTHTAATSGRAEDKSRRLLQPPPTRLPVVYSCDGWFVTATDAHAGVRIPGHNYQFRAPDQAVLDFRACVNAFTRQLPPQGQILVTNSLLDPGAWAGQLKTPHLGSPNPNHNRYVDAAAAAIRDARFPVRDCLLFSRLGDRQPGGVRGWWLAFLQTVLGAANLTDTQPDLDEIQHWDERTESVVETLQHSWLRGEPLTQPQLEWVVRHLDGLGEDPESLSPIDQQEWGAGDWATILASATEVVPLGGARNRYNCLQIDGPAGRTYAALCVLARIPAALHFEANWLHLLAGLPFPVDASVTFDILDPHRAESALKRPLGAAEAQIEEDTSAGVDDAVTRMQRQGLQDVHASVRMGRQPLAVWQAVFVVTAADKPELLGRVTKLIAAYSDQHMEVVCPPHDQRSLYYSLFPGAVQQSAHWVHRTDPAYLAAAMPWLDAGFGDGMGHYQGYTVTWDAQGRPQTGCPVFYDVLNIASHGEEAPAEIVTGSPGSGKTVSKVCKPLLEAALGGRTLIVWDPKGDTLPLSYYAQQLGLIPEKVKLVNLLDPESSVSLDPFAIGGGDAAIPTDVVMGLCRTFVTDQGQGLEYQTLIRTAVRIVLQQARAGAADASMNSLLGVLTAFSRQDFSALEEGEKPNPGWDILSRNLRTYLAAVAGTTLGRLLFLDARTVGSVKVEPGDLTIFVALGLPLTERDGAGNRATPTDTTIVGDTIAALMTDLIRRLLAELPDDLPKGAVFDEWHAIRDAPGAERLVDWLQRMGRSKRTTVTLLSQSPRDFAEVGAVTTVWCGKCADTEDAKAACKLLQIPADQDNLSLLQQLGKGQFLARDAAGRVALVQIDFFDLLVLELFSTDPATKAAMLAGAQAQQTP